MRFLLNENISRKLISRLASAGYESLHILDCGLQGRRDEEIIQYAIDQDLIIVTHDLDYGRLISLSGLNRPSAITFRQGVVSTDILFSSFIEAVPKFQQFLENGALISIDSQVVRYRLLPFTR